ncbi:MAG: hypothetical protein RI932_798 [Pseudomonadota bacterium]|jgi:hypothetical protein
MKKNSALNYMKLMLAGLVIPTMLSSSCGRAPVEYLDESVSNVEVTGAFTDWTPGTSSFAGGRFVLLDPTTSEVFVSNEISATQPKFTIENVPVAGRYYGILIDSRFEPRAYIEKKMADGKKLRLFKLNNTIGKLGTSVVRDQSIEPSQQADLEFQTNLGVVSGRKAFDKEFSATFSPNPDIDEDGIPNIIDTDVDGDVGGPNSANIKYNIFDAFTYNKSEKLPDSSIAWQFNYAYGIPKLGFFKCNYLRSPSPPAPPAAMTDPSETQTNFELTFSCALKLPSSFAQSVELMTVKSLLDAAKDSDGIAFDKKMRDDGKSGDLIASDGIWTGQLKITEGSPESFKEQLIFASVKLASGAYKTFVTVLEPKTTITKDNLTRTCPSNANSLAGLAVSLNLESGKADLNEFNVSLRLRSETGQTVESDKDGNKLPPLSFKYVAPNKFEFTGAENTFTLSNGTYFPLIKITAPSALPGILGSAFELYLPGLSIGFTNNTLSQQCTTP